MSSLVLIIDDDESMCEMLDLDLRRRGFRTYSYQNAEDAFGRLADEAVDVVLTDLNLPGMSGIELCQRIVANRPDVPVVVLTAFGSLDTAVAAIRAGAYDFVTKPVDLDLLVIALERALKHRTLQEQVRILSETARKDQSGALIGESSPMLDLKRRIDRIADTDTSVLIQGESGTGKELVARTLHECSRRKDQPFVALSCAALPETLLESELFGYKRGAFTDAKTDKRGLLLEAQGGTLFLDEIGEMSLVVQPKLLRTLEERRLRPLGGTSEIPFDVRILAATNRDLEGAVEEGRFREDLFYRLNVIQLSVPPLRSRGTDVLLLASHYVDQFARRFRKEIQGLTEGAAEKLLAYSWPGNVRELRNAVEHAVALARLDKVVVEDLPEKIRAFQASHVILDSQDPADFVSMEDLERRYIQHVLKAAGDNRTMAARILGFDRKTLYRKLQRYAKSSPQDA